jgi:hypothetical protein
MERNLRKAAESLHASKSINVKALADNPRSEDANMLGGEVFLP